jgi:hypothetical protein
MVSYVICTLATVHFLLLHTPYIVEGAVTHEKIGKIDRRSILGEEVTIHTEDNIDEVKHNDQ